MLNRAFEINTDTDVTILNTYNDCKEVSKWAKQSYSNVLTIVLENNEEISIFDEGLFPKEYITQKEMFVILKPVLASNLTKLTNKSFMDKLSDFWHSINEIRIILGITISAIIVTIFKLIKYLCKKYKTSKEVIYVGDMATGKTELSKVLPHPNSIRKNGNYTPSRAVRKAGPVKIKNNDGYTSFNGTTVDTPGGSNEALLSLLKNKRITQSGKIIIIVLAHTKSSNNCSVDHNYLNEQYDRIDKVIILEINNYKKRVSKIIIFINKCDILPQSYQSDWGKTEETIYKKHLDLISKRIRGIKIDVVTGSATKRKNLFELRNSLH